MGSVYATTADEVVWWAKSQKGYCEKKTNAYLDDFTANAGSNNYNKFARDLYSQGYFNGNKNGYAWCACFAAWIFLQACGEKTKARRITAQDRGTYGAGCDFAKAYYKAEGRLYTTPKVGDQVFFKQSGKIVHTGLVIGVGSTYITTIEGNKNNKVTQCSYLRSSSYIDSYGRPNYDSVQWTKDTEGKWWLTINGEAVQDAWYRYYNKWYWMKPGGIMAENEFIEYNGASYYLKDGGAMATGWLKLDGKWYYFNGSGAMQKSTWLKYNSKWYYLMADGVMATGWLKWKDQWYYLDSSGAMVTGTQKIDGITYTFSASGAKQG